MDERHREQLGQYAVLLLGLGCLGLQCGLCLAFYLRGYWMLTAVWLVVIWVHGWADAFYVHWYISQWHAEEKDEID